MVRKKKAKTGTRTGPRKTARKKTVKKKTVKARAGTAANKKKAVKKTVKKKSVKKAARKKTKKRTVSAGQKAPKRGMEKQVLPVEPGPPSGSIPPVEEPTRQEEAIGIVTHYYSHLGVAVVQVNKGSLRTGDTVHFKGHTTDFTQKVASMEYEHQHTDQAGAGQSVGLKVVDHAREHDIVYLVK